MVIPFGRSLCDWASGHLALDPLESAGRNVAGWRERIFGHEVSGFLELDSSSQTQPIKKAQIDL